MISAQDSSFLSRDHQAVLTYLFADVVRELGEELNLRQQVCGCVRLSVLRSPPEGLVPARFGLDHTACAIMTLP